MTDVIHAKIVGSGDKFLDMISMSTLDMDEDYDNAYLNITPGNCSVVFNLPGASVSSYSNFYSPEYFQSIEVGPEYRGEEAQALFKISSLMFYLDLVDDGESITMEFRGSPDAELAETVTISSSLTAKIHLPNSRSIMEKVDKSIMSRYDSDNTYGVGEKQLDTKVYVHVNELKKIIDVVEADEISDIRQFPIVVENGQLCLNVGDRKTRNTVSGPLRTEKVEGPDCESWYEPGFVQSVNSFSGIVVLNTGPSARGAPLSIYKEGKGFVARHAMAPVVKR